MSAFPWSGDGVVFVVGDDVAFRFVVRDGDGVGDAVGFELRRSWVCTWRCCWVCCWKRDWIYDWRDT